MIWFVQDVAVRALGPFCCAGPHPLRCLAAHIRCGALSHEDAEKISGLTSDETKLAVDRLAQLQKEASTSKQYKHPE